MTQFEHTWYTPGDWSLPAWWTAGPPIRDAARATMADQDYFYNSSFVRNVLGHKGGMTTPPPTTRRAM
jgi:hypothetical protein